MGNNYGDMFASPLLQVPLQIFGGLLMANKGEEVRQQNPFTRFQGLLDTNGRVRTSVPGVNTVNRQTGTNPRATVGEQLSVGNLTEQALGEAGRAYEAEVQKANETRQAAQRLGNMVESQVGGARDRAAQFRNAQARGRQALAGGFGDVQRLQQVAASIPQRSLLTMASAVRYSKQFYDEAKSAAGDAVKSSADLLTAHLQAAHNAAKERIGQAKDELAREMQNRGASRDEIDAAGMGLDYKLGADIFTANAELAANEHARHTQVMLDAAGLIEQAGANMQAVTTQLASGVQQSLAVQGELEASAAQISTQIRRQQAEYETNSELAYNQLQQYADGLQYQGNWDVAMLIRDIPNPVLMTSPVLMTMLQTYMGVAQADNAIVQEDRAAELGNYGVLYTAAMNALGTAGELANASLQRQHETAMANKSMIGSIGGGALSAAGSLGAAGILGASKAAGAAGAAAGSMTGSTPAYMTGLGNAPWYQ